ncbi:cytochrome c [Chitinophaga polysaccharea]|uniref:c-type cytochrome n=1 Tax=Chitinophaga TaxID=79328 RepID=UPI001454F1CC|nr:MULTISPECIES: cytochrome c [Chitinophaga]NLR58326.1 cytochrome c [Chitinophaga polysaccharea]NLU90852.1 cytochrome c [Chitinophaga sp. Ak27]
MKNKVLFFLFLLLPAFLRAADPVSGKKLFQARCASCHNVNKKLIGPALAGVENRRSLEWILSFVKGSQSMIKAGDKDALTVYNQNNQVTMPDHPDLSDDLIKDILAYVKEEASKAPKDEAPFARPSQKQPHLMPLTIYNMPFMIAYIMLVIIMIILLIFLVNLKSYEKHMDDKRKE